MKIYKDAAIAAADILLPREGTDLSKWAVIACDQYTSEPEYWNKADEIVGDAPSTLRIVLPEVWLGTDAESEKLASIADNINGYLNDGVWGEPLEGFVILDRSTPLHPTRKGIMLAVDLEQYNYEPGNKAAIRATEGTVLSRIPPRVRIRANAQVEVPHIMLLMDDPDDTVIGRAWDNVISSGAKPVYDTDLMQGSGHITGYYVAAGSEVGNGIVNALTALKAASADGMLFAVGDGNHSLASAKAHWDNIKKDLSDEERIDHPARFALAEAVNIHDKGIDFEPIHRVVFGMERDKFIETALGFFKGSKAGKEAAAGMQSFIVTGKTPEEDTVISIPEPPHSLAVGSVQILIDNIIASDKTISCDYIHGEDSVRKIASEGDRCGILLDSVSKFTFFDTIVKDGVFPRKTFSMGEAFEKRFYMEARKIER